MTTEEDKLFLDILDSCRGLEYEEDDEMMVKFAVLYREKVQDKEFKPNPVIWEMVKNIIPEYFL